MKLKKKRVLWVLLVMVAALLVTGCRSERFGQRKAPRNCHSCTKWG